MLVALGIELHQGRAVEPILPDDERHDPDGTYDDHVGITYRPFCIDVEGLRICATPRRIGVREVAASAKSSCRHCHGVGWFPVERQHAMGEDQRGRKIMQTLRYEKSCVCAERRYKSQHKRFVIDSQLGEWIALDQLTVEHHELQREDPGGPVRPRRTDDAAEEPAADVELASS